MAAALAFLAAWALAAAMAGTVAAMLGGGSSIVNYSGKSIPTGMGTVLLLAVLGGLGILNFAGMLDAATLRQQGFWLTLVCLAGLVDDAFGNHESRGFRGHFGALFRGRLTTGMAKVLIVSLGAVLVSLPLSWQALLEAAVLILSVNLFNQLDLRPGRALKTFVFLLGGLALAGNVPAAVGCGASLGLLPGDLRSDYMLGDAGSNLLGAIAGQAIAAALTKAWLPIILVFLVLGNGAGEFFSFSRIIEKSKILRWIDKIGRPQAGK